MGAILRHRPSPAMVIACIGLAVALGGTSYAAIKLPKLQRPRMPTTRRQPDESGPQGEGAGRDQLLSVRPRSNYVFLRKASTEPKNALRPRLDDSDLLQKALPMRGFSYRATRSVAHHVVRGRDQNKGW